jgi:hypothetical protein
MWILISLGILVVAVVLLFMAGKGRTKDRERMLPRGEFPDEMNTWFIHR